MRYALLVLILFVGVCWAGGEEEQREGWRGDRDRDDKVTESDRRDDRNRDDGNRDRNRDEDNRNRDESDRDIDESNRNGTLQNRDLYFPCDFEDDIDCVRHYFASSGQCKEAHNYGRKPVYRNRLMAYLPGFNLTLVITRTRVKYINDRISRFYINKTTDNLVMAIDFEGINIDSRYTTFVYQRRGQEPIKRSDFTNGTFPVTLTAVIPLKKEINFKESRVTAYLQSPPEQIVIGPRVLNSTDPTVVQVNTAVFANIPQAALEIFLTEAPSLYFGYLQKYICDFGIPISS